MSVIHITQEYPDNNSVESTVIYVRDVMELHCVYPLKDNDEESDDELFDTFGNLLEKVSELEISLVNGERRNFDTTKPTVFRIISDEGSVKRTTNLNKFEEMYISMLAVGEVKEANNQVLVK